MYVAFAEQAFITMEDAVMALCLRADVMKLEVGR
jgi:hypothetical protein